MCRFFLFAPFCDGVRSVAPLTPFSLSCAWIGLITTISDRHGVCLSNAAWGGFLVACQYYKLKADFTHAVFSDPEIVTISLKASFV